MKKRSMSRLLSLCLLLVLCCAFSSACGKKEESRAYGIDGVVYVPRPFAPAVTAQEQWQEKYEGGNGGWGEVQYNNGYLYYYFMEDIRRLPVDGEGEAGEEEIVMADMSRADSTGKHFAGYTVDEEGSLYLLLLDQPGWQATSQEEEERYRSGTLLKKLSDGTVAYQISLSGIPLLQTYEENQIALGSGHELYVLAADGIYLFDPEGKQVGKIETKGVLSETNKTQILAEGKDGKVYYCVDEVRNSLSTEMTLYEVDRGGRLLEVMRGFQGTLRGSSFGLLLENDGTISRYQEENRSFQEIFRLQDSDLYASVNELVQISEDCFVICSADYAADAFEWYLLTGTPTDELPPKETLVLATLGSYDLENMAARFNRTNDRYHVIVETFGGEGWQERLDARIVSSDPPDLLDLNNGIHSLDIRKYAGKQVLEDLTPYLEESEALSPEMIWDAILESYTIDDRLVCVPTRFNIRALVGRKDLLGTKEGWTLEEMRELLEENPRLMPVPWLPKVDNFFDDMMEYMCGDSLLEEFVDQEAGECGFQDKEFLDFMGWLVDYCRDKEMVPNYQEAESEELLSTVIDVGRVWDLLDVQSYAWASKEGLTLKGFPTASGEPVYAGIPMDSLGILSVSERKEGAWEFLEFYLTREYDEGIDIPFRKDQVEKYLEEAMTPEYYYDEEGQVMIDARTGEPRKKTKAWISVNGEFQGCDVLPEETADQFLDLIAHTRFTLRNSTEENILAIIREEMSYCLAGQKSVEEAAELIQNRALILLKESGE